MTLIDFALSFLKKELPEIDKSWFIYEKKISEIEYLFKKNKILYLPKIMLLASGLNSFALVITFFVYFMFTFFILFPVEIPKFHVFEIKSFKFVEKKWCNHFVNILTLFSGINDSENGFKIIPKNVYGVFILISGKVSFALVILNFIYKKLVDKLTE